ncbi:MAG: site-specific DNA-methyltransferase [Armatimonadetes bacterium]|nr:site-specific DNA-methyltransferase [Armatimonadota bacterium]MDW8029554.1 DNA methyltransferase [Armatimonadota bacterium]
MGGEIGSTKRGNFNRFKQIPLFIQKDFQSALTKLQAKTSESKEIKVSFRRLASFIPSTTYSVFGLYRYPAKFIPQVVAYILEHYAEPGGFVLDPFAGSGTTGLVARIYGLDYELWDLNPMLEVLHKVSTMKPPKLNRSDLRNLIEEMRSSELRFQPSWSNISYWFPPEVLQLLEKVFGWFHHLEDEEIKLLCTVPLLKVMRLFSFNDPQRQKLSRSPKSISRIASLMQGDWKERFFEIVHEEIETVLKKLIEYQALVNEGKKAKAVIRAGVDALELAQTANGEWDILVTSPPYLQAQEYIRGSKLDLFWLGYTEPEVKRLSGLEIPYRHVPPVEIYSPTYRQIHQEIEEQRIRLLFERYFFGVLSILTELSHFVRSRMFLFVGPASIRARPIPIDQIFAEHFVNLGWEHEATLVDTIVARTLFRAHVNPATGLSDRRMPTEHLVILKRKE